VSGDEQAWTPTLLAAFGFGLAILSLILEASGYRGELVLIVALAVLASAFLGLRRR
jgi:hypothetical protein